MTDKPRSVGVGVVELDGVVNPEDPELRGTMSDGPALFL
jgi:hypothetical protein